MKAINEFISGLNEGIKYRRQWGHIIMAFVAIGAVTGAAIALFN